MSEQEQKSNHKKLVLRLMGVVFGMFLFGFALVPLYDVFCEVTGINGKTRGQALYQTMKVDNQREISVTFLSNIDRGMPWDFKPLVASIKVHPGELNEVRFYAKNRSHKAIVGQAVPSISPGEGALYLNKTECFCFGQQHLEPGEEIEMPIKFYLDPAIPENITNLTLSYQMYNVTETANAAAVAAK